jgi:hypothetical protein
MYSVRERKSAPPARGAVASHRQRRPRRRRRRGRGCLIGVLAAVGLLASAAFFLGPGRSDAPTAVPRPRTTTSTIPVPVHASTPGPAPTTKAGFIDVPATGAGTFVAAQAGHAKAGHGAHLLRYAVEVETGIGISPAQAAKEIAGVLAAPRGWTRDGVSSFQLVSAREPYDLKVRIATPGTADALCWAGIHQDTQGEYNCEIPDGVVVNLRRWVEGSPTFDGPIQDYRALIINHEMGHFLGYAHMTCPGPGRQAPVMMQQIKGLDGCVANAWPYDTSGRLVTGPPVQ